MPHLGIQVVTFLGYQSVCPRLISGPKNGPKKCPLVHKLTSKYLTNATFRDPNGHFLGVPKCVSPPQFRSKKRTKKVFILANMTSKHLTDATFWGSKWSLFWVYQKRVRPYRFWTKIDQKSVYSCKK